MTKARIIVDAMSGDNAPKAIIEGALSGAVEYGTDLLLVGNPEIIKPILDSEAKKYQSSPVDTLPDIMIKESQSVVTMEDDPSIVIKEKTDSSLAIATKLLKEGAGDALISAGNTGAIFTAATLVLRRIKGVRRAALAAIVPLDNPFVLIDSGANTDVQPEMLEQFAHMGAFYAERVMGIKSPRVGLINNGVESHKGTELQQDAYKLLKKTDLNFIGNIESRELPANACDVAVCDGFTGNIALKLIEGMASFMSRKLKQLFYSNSVTKFAAVLTQKQLDELKRSMDHREHGGAVLLGISKPVIKAHGSSDAYSISRTVKQAADYALGGVIDALNEEFTKKKFTRIRGLFDGKEEIRKDEA